MSTARVDFTRGAAERIAKVVRIVEEGERDQTGPKWGRVLETQAPRGLKLGTFTGNWPLNSYKVVTFYNVTSTPNTASVLNLCTPSVGFSTANTAESRYVVFGRVRYTTDPLVVEIQQAATSTSCTLTLGAVDLTQLSGYSAGEVQLLGHGAGDVASTTNGCLQWFSITTCATATSSP